MKLASNETQMFTWFNLPGQLEKLQESAAGLTWAHIRSYVAEPGLQLGARNATRWEGPRVVACYRCKPWENPRQSCTRGWRGPNWKFRDNAQGRDRLNHTTCSVLSTEGCVWPLSMELSARGLSYGLSALWCVSASDETNRVNDKFSFPFFCKFP